jgi:ABC-2 type transport system permease protein
MNAVVADLTLRGLLGRRRALILLLLPVILLVLAFVMRWFDAGDEASVGLLVAFGSGIVLPLVGLIAGTGAIGPEIDDGSIIYLLAKPLNRFVIIVTKLVVAVAVIAVFAALPVLLAALILPGVGTRLALGFAVGVLAAGIAYAAVFLLLGVITRNAVVAGLIYALIWESVVGVYVPGARALSIQQWGRSVTQAIGESTILRPEVGTAAGVTLLVVVTLAATWYAGWRLRALRLTGDE